MLSPFPHRLFSNPKHWHILYLYMPLAECLQNLNKINFTIKQAHYLHELCVCPHFCSNCRI